MVTITIKVQVPAGNFCRTFKHECGFIDYTRCCLIFNSPLRSTKSEKLRKCTDCKEAVSTYKKGKIG